MVVNLFLIRNLPNYLQCDLPVVRNDKVDFIDFYNSQGNCCQLSTIDIEESRKDKSLVRLAHSKPVYDNVGGLFFNWLIGRKAAGSAVYIEGKTCLTCAHCYHPFINEVGFELRNQKTKYYKIKHFIVHPEFQKNIYYDLAVIILDRPVEGLDPLKISNDFSKSQTFKEGQHPLTYVGYGLKLFGNNWFHIADGKRRAKRAHTQYCKVDTKKFRLVSSPYGRIVASGKDREFEPYEVCFCEGSSGGAVFNSKDELVALNKGIFYIPSVFDVAYLCISYVINIIPVFIDAWFFTFPALSTAHVERGVQTLSTPLAPLKDWIEAVQQQYGEDAHIV